MAAGRRSLAAKGKPGQAQTGEALWWISGESQRVEIRGEVADLAGNPAVSHAQVGATISPAGTPSRGETADAGESQTVAPVPARPPRTQRPQRFGGDAHGKFPMASQCPARTPATTRNRPLLHRRQPRHDEPRSIARGRGRAAGRLAGSSARRTPGASPLCRPGHHAIRPGRRQAPGGRAARGPAPGRRLLYVRSGLRSPVDRPRRRRASCALGDPRRRPHVDPFRERSRRAEPVGGHGWRGRGLRVPDPRGSRRDGGRTIAAERTAPDVWVVVRLAKPQAAQAATAADLSGPTARIRDVRSP